MKRKVVKIDEDLCDGCGVCIPNCAEGALQLIDGKARLISDLFCDGLGACLGHCPQGAIEIEEREAEAYDEKKVMDYIVKGGRNVILAHLTHMKEHNELGYLKEAIEYLRENGIEVPAELTAGGSHPHHAGCPGSRTLEIKRPQERKKENSPARESLLRQWPVQLHLLNPSASYFNNADVLLAADCTAFAAGDFHQDYLDGKTLAIACPKLDQGKDIYLKKLQMMIEDSGIRSITVLIMEVPCCRGLLQLAQQAVALSGRELPVNVIVLNIQGEKILEREV
ncbi:MAG: ATP-binding protein [Bacteroidota bacterium]|jgi:NAD-dependent dihydropyrimidine dehydrogenase PreA subunit|nr:4Fe-4S ferredoxin [Ignavibacteria bacterium]MCU7512622.1 4Fe-4S ferredoxin [Ignavibacteria bacterium]MCU7521230.1 4Fe-4S ferredoxin [Ignavibacteria bacterium]